MKTLLVLLSSLIVANLATAVEPLIEVEVRFIEICETMPEPTKLSWQLDGSGQSLVASDMSNLLSSVEQSGSVDLLSSPRVTTQSGSNAIIKVVSECIYPTEVDIRHVSVTNGEKIVRSVELIPRNFVTRDVGITLNVTPAFRAEENMIDLQLMAEVVSEPIWKDYIVKYEGADGSKQEFPFTQPFFHTRQISPSLSLHNDTTVVMGGMITTKKARVEDRVPILGSIPWFGRLFRSSRELNEKRNLFITITARTVGDTH